MSKQLGVTLLFDGDIIAYRAGFAAEKRVYHDERDHPNDGGKAFSLKKDALIEIPEEHLVWYREAEPVENALHNCSSLIENTIDYACEHFEVQREAVNYLTYMTGNVETPNFRMEVDPEYKANRDPAHKPTHLGEIKVYLKMQHNGYLTEGCEADDFFGQACLTLRSKNLTPVICSIDKDLQQIPGFHFNFTTGTIDEVSEERAAAVFWRQMLEGDRVDNITGINGIGPVKASKLIPVGTTNEQAQETVEEAYKKEFADDWSERYNKNCDLLWIWRKVPDSCPFKTAN